MGPLWHVKTWRVRVACLFHILVTSSFFEHIVKPATASRSHNQNLESEDVWHFQPHATAVLHWCTINSSVVFLHRLRIEKTSLRNTRPTNFANNIGFKTTSRIRGHPRGSKCPSQACSVEGEHGKSLTDEEFSIAILAGKCCQTPPDIGFLSRQPEGLTYQDS